MRISNSGVTVQNDEESYLVVEVKKRKTVIQSFLNLNVQFIIREWSFSPEGEMVYFATRVVCASLM